VSTPTPSGTVLPFGGLTDDQAVASRARHGANVLTPPRREPWWKLYLEKFQDPVIRILIIAAVIAIAAGAYHHEYAEGVGILVAILLSTALAFWNEYRAGREFDLLNRVDDDIPVKAIRNGRVLTLPKRDVVVGDVLLLELGEEVPADGKLLEAVSLQVDESRLTGESVPVTKQVEIGEDAEAAYPSNRLLRGTLIADGRGVLEVTAVGDLTEIGQTARAAGEENREPTPLDRQLARLSKLIGVAGLGFAVLTFFGLLLQAWLSHKLIMAPAQWAFTAILIVCVFAALSKVWLPMVFDALEVLRFRVAPPHWVESRSIRGWAVIIAAAVLLFAAVIAVMINTGFLPDDPTIWMPGAAGETLLRYFMVSVTIIVVAVPEGLAMSVTLALAYSMRRMTASNNLVRRMHACETIGAATVICTDKTGTLTLNQMSIHAIHIPMLGPCSEGYSASVARTPSGSLLAEAMSVNSTAHLSRENDGVRPVGNPTEAATLLWLDSLGVDYQEQRLRFRTIRQWTFSTERKFMGTHGQAPGLHGCILHVKGAPEIILTRCTMQRGVDGDLPLAPEERRGIERVLKSYQERGMRTLGLACHDTVGTYVPSDMPLETLAQGLTWLGFVAIHDPVRPEVPGAVEQCVRAGVAVKMVTGDNPSTAKEIARQIHLWKDAEEGQPNRLLTGPEFEAMPEPQAREAVRSIKVLARARPLDKLRLVRLLKDNGEVVAVTGDGTNDAPAMNYADVGLAMGKTGTAVAKEASDIILLDDSFKSIVNAILWGRSLYQNIQRFLFFQLTINFSALTLALLAAFLTGGNTPLTVMQLLWVNLIMDTFAALALATEPPEPYVMRRPPRRPDAFIITPTIARGILGYGLLFVVLLAGLLLWFQSRGPLDYDAASAVLRSATASEAEREVARTTQQHLSIFFTFYVLLQFWNLFNARCLGTSRSVFRRLFQNRLFWIIAMAILVGQFVITQFGSQVFSTYPLTATQWAVLLLSSAGVLAVGELVRLLQRARRWVRSGS